MTEHFGKTESETIASENLMCREIVAEILRFGVNQRQLLTIIRLLAFELEDFDQKGREIIGAIDSFDENILVTGLVK